MPLLGTVLVSIVAGYAVGSLSFAWLIGRSQGVDIRKHGSGNVGATNVQRVLGKSLGRLCFVLDFAKGAVPVLIAQAVTGPDSAWIPVAVGAAAVAGHVWPFTLRFKGGKGFATSLGVVAALVPLCFVAAIAVWLGVFFSSRYVSLASIAAAAALPLTAHLLGWLSPFRIAPSVHALLWVLAVLVAIRHKSNIQRLIRGEEQQFNQGKNR